MNNCTHNEGWILKEEIVIDPALENDNIVAEFVCNTVGCEEKRTFKFDIINIVQKNYPKFKK